MSFQVGERKKKKRREEKERERREEREIVGDRCKYWEKLRLMFWKSREERETCERNSKERERGRLEDTWNENEVEGKRMMMVLVFGGENCSLTFRSVPTFQWTDSVVLSLPLYLIPFHDSTKYLSPFTQSVSLSLSLVLFFSQRFNFSLPVLIELWCHKMTSKWWFRREHSFTLLTPDLIHCWIHISLEWGSKSPRERKTNGCYLKSDGVEGERGGRERWGRER